MSYEAIGRRYAQAIFELATEANASANVCREFADFAATYEGSDELRIALDNPLVPENEREAVLRDVAGSIGMSELAANAALLLLRRRRMSGIPEIAKQLSRLLDQASGIVRATVTSATPLSEAYLSRLREELERLTGKKVVLAPRQDPTLIAGVVTQIGDRVIDGSVRAQLTSFRDSLLAT